MLCEQNTLMIMRTMIRHERATDQTSSQDELQQGVLNDATFRTPWLQQHPRMTTDALKCVFDSSQRCLHCTGPMWASDVFASLPQRGAPEC